MDSLQLFQLFFHYMAGDFLRSHEANIARQLCLSSIDEQLKTIGSSNPQIGLPEPENIIYSGQAEGSFFSEVADAVLNETQ